MEQAEDSEYLGLVHVYTGDGKGKTTSALGLALRASGHGLRALMVQFMKTPGFYSECRAVDRLENMDIVSTARSCLVFEDEATPEDHRAAREGLALAEKALSSGDYDLVILDEVNVAVKWRLLDPHEVLRVIGRRSRGVEVVLTGRYSPREFLDVADYVTEMRCLKHPYQRGVTSRWGIDK